jgi:hypothetical protein
MISLVILLSLFLGSNAFAEKNLIETVEINCKDNCAIYNSRKWQDKVISIKLPPGKYKFVPASGACSSWAKDQIAYDNGNQPWMWYAIISDQGNQYELGSQAKYDTPQKAFEEQKYEEVTIRLESEISIQIGFTDVWKGKDYCSDNRGSEKMEIYKITNE